MLEKTLLKSFKNTHIITITRKKEGTNERKRESKKRKGEKKGEAKTYTAHTSNYRYSIHIYGIYKSTKNPPDTW